MQKKSSYKLGFPGKNKNHGEISRNTRRTCDKAPSFKQEREPKSLVRIKFKLRDGSENSGQTTPRRSQVTSPGNRSPRSNFKKSHITINENSPITPNRAGNNSVTFPKLEPT